jgi:DNA adenine methylase
MYLGGKTRIAKYIVPVLESVRGGRDYIEPFCGSCSIVSRMSGRRTAADAHADLILMWQAAQRGWVPPTSVSEEMFNSLRKAKSSKLRGFVGFGCSFSGMWFGTYARDPKSNRNYAMNASNVVVSDAARMRDVVFVHASFERFSETRGALVYCDPPYESTHGYRGTDFDRPAFWNFVRRLSRRDNVVIVSEYEAPSDFKSILDIRRDRGLAPVVDGSKGTRMERLFMLGAS